MLSLIKNVCGENFVKQISTCFEFADTFSLTRNNWLKPDEQENSLHLLQRLEPYHIETRHTNHWFCYYVPKEANIELYLFHATADAKIVLLSAYSQMFNDGVLWTVPEDLCFFKNGRLIFGSVSHENICFVYDEELGAQLRNCGEWESVAAEESEQILL